MVADDVIMRYEKVECLDPRSCVKIVDIQKHARLKILDVIIICTLCAFHVQMQFGLDPLSCVKIVDIQKHA